MRNISIVRKAGSPYTGFTAVVRIDGQGSHDVTITNPFRKKEENELELYFEEWHRFPFVNTSVAKRAASSIKDYGMHLFKQVFDCEQSCKEYAAVLDHLSEVVIEIVSQSPDFHALHWEALWDPGRPRPLAVDCTIVRKSMEEIPLPISTDASPVLNLLVVVARPEGEWDAGYRTISRPVVEAVQAGKLRVNVELLRPGTFEALSKQLEARGPGYYHIVHFDCHGELLDYDQARFALNYDTERQRRRYGRKPLGRYKGVKAFLMLEGNGAGAVDLIKAPELAKLLVGKHVPICILNACQSGKQVLPNIDPLEELAENPVHAYETSLGSCLLNKGLQVVVAMAYRVTVSGAQVMMREFYSQLCAQRPVLESLQWARLQLHNDKRRRAYHNEIVQLEDWLLPVVYANQSADLKLGDFEDAQEREVNSPSFNSGFKTPENGFVGRDLDILKIEIALVQHSGLLLRGMGGTGKTTLLKYLCEWWQTTCFAKSVFYFGYDERAWTLHQILLGIIQQICDEHRQRKLQILCDVVLEEEVVIKLSDGPCILILDNLESATGKEPATMNTLAPDELARIHSFLNRLVSAQAKVVLGSRSGEEWLSDVFGKNVHHLQGLDHESQYLLAQKILERCVHEESRVVELNQNDDFHQLMKILGGYPLAMEVVLANLEQQTPVQILKGLDEADIHLDAASLDKDSSILRCVEYSFNVMCPKTQCMLLCLAPFSFVLVQRTLNLYIKALQGMELFRQFNFAQLGESIKEAIKWGLLSPSDPLESSDDELSIFNIQPVFPYFLKMKLGGSDGEQHKALRIAFKIACQDAANAYDEMMESVDAKERNHGLRLCNLEYENLHNALVMCMEDMESTNIRTCLNRYFARKADYQSGLKLALQVVETQGAYPPQFKTEDMVEEIADAQFHSGLMYSKLSAHQKAKEAYEQAIQALQSLHGGAKGNRHALGHIYHNLGSVAQKMRDFVKAHKSYQRALDIWIEFGDQHAQASTYHQMGTVAQEMREFVEARQCYQRALSIKIELGDRHSQGSTYHNLGTVAQKMRNYMEARKNYQRALDIWIEFSDRHLQASSYHQIGRVAQEMREFVEARQCYQRALDIWIEFGNRHSQAKAYHHIGIVAEEMRDYADARQNYQRALDIWIEFDDYHSQAITYQQLGIVAAKLRDFVEAGQHCQRALDICTQFGDYQSQASCCHDMGRVAQEMREFAEARENYQRALDIWIELDDWHSQAKTYHQMGRVAQEKMEFVEAHQHYQRALDIWIKLGDRHSQASTHHHIGMVAEEMWDLADAHQHYQRAVDIWIEFDDRYSQAITYRQMGIVATKMSNFVEAHENYQRALDIWIEFGDRSSQAKIYHHMGRAAQGMGEFSEAHKNYQRALDIWIELGDYHSQASTYQHMGIVAKELGDFA